MTVGRRRRRDLRPRRRAAARAQRAPARGAARRRAGACVNPSGAHAVAVGVDADVEIDVEGHVGYYCAGMNKRATVRVHGNAGVGLAENIMSGTVRVDGYAGQSCAATGRGGLVVVRGDAVRALRHLHEGRRHRRARLRRAHERVHGPEGPARGRAGDAGEALGDSLYEARLYVRGSVASLGADCVEKELREEHRAELAELLRAAGAVDADPGGVPPLRVGAAALQLRRRPRRGVLMEDRSALRESATFPRHVIAEIQRAAREGLYDIRGWGAKRRVPHFDDLLFLGASVSRYPLEGYRERCDTDVVLGDRHASRPLHLQIPITIAGMSFGALSGPAKEALGRGATAMGTATTTGDGGMTEEERGHSETLVYQLLPSRYGMNPDDLRRADAIEIVIGQGAKPGGGGMLLGQKISDRVAAMRDLPVGIDQRSACRHPDWTGPDDLEIKIQRAARDHRLGEADLRQGRRHAHVLRRRPGREGGRRRDRARRHAGRHRGHAGRLHRARRHPDPRRHPPGRGVAAGARHAPARPARRLRRDPLGRRRGQGARAGRRRGLDRRRRADRARRQRARAGGGVRRARHGAGLLRRLAGGARPGRDLHPGRRARRALRPRAGRPAARQLPAHA